MIAKLTQQNSLVSCFRAGVATAVGLTALFLPLASGAAAIQPFTNLQPSLAVTELFLASGSFPDRSIGSPSGDEMGFIRNFGGSFVPSGSALANGGIVGINNNLALYAVIGSTYGGNGTTTIAIPNLLGQTPIGAGSGAGLTPRSVGDSTGSTTVTLSTAQLPPPQGLGQPFNNLQPSLTLQPLINVGGANPLVASRSSNFIGEISYFAGGYVPTGFMAADGALLPILGNETLFSIIGTQYGGDGILNFALPDLQGRVAVGADARLPAGTKFGEESTVVTTAQLPPGGSPVNDDQPSLALNFLIAIDGVFPAPDPSRNSFDTNMATLGEIVLFAGDFVPQGYARANGALLLVSQNLSLFSVLGTSYGGDGNRFFALPDFDGRAVIGADGDHPVGQQVGVDSVVLVGTSSASVPEPTSLALMTIGLGCVGWVRRRRGRARIRV